MPPRSDLGHADGRPRITVRRRPEQIASHRREQRYFAEVNGERVPTNRGNGTVTLGEVLIRALTMVDRQPAVIIWEGELNDQG